MGIGAVSRPAVFLDRDGVLVEEVFYPESGEWEAPWRADDVRLVPGAAAAARRLAEAGFALVLVSNQGAHAKGKASLRDLWRAHERFATLLAEDGVRLDGVFYSWGHPDGIAPHFSGPSLDRKPGAYNVLLAAAQLDLDLGASFFVGDRATDMECGHRAGVRGLLIEGERTRVAPGTECARAASLAEAVDLILNLHPPA